MKYLIPAFACLAAASPVAQNQQSSLIAPTTLSVYYYLSGQVQYNVDTGIVDRYPSNGGADHGTLITFNYPNNIAGKQCQAVFDLGRLDKVSGTGKAQVFTSLKSAQPNQKGNNRNEYLGTLNVVYGRATWDAAYGGVLGSNNGNFPCSSVAGKTIGYELAPVGDTDRIEFVKSNGFKVQIL